MTIKCIEGNNCFQSKMVWSVAVVALANEFHQENERNPELACPEN
jgi:hypothetical protein